MESFSKKIKTQLENDEIKKKCCKKIFHNVIELKKEKNSDIFERLSEIYQNVKCENCAVNFVKAVFVLYGCVTDPEKAFHLDFSFKYDSVASFVQNILLDLGYEFKLTTRKDKFVLYINRFFHITFVLFFKKDTRNYIKARF